MQIDSANLAHLGMSIANAFDACRSTQAGPRILEEDYQAAVRDKLSSYNTGDPARGIVNGYVARVEARVPDIAANRLPPSTKPPPSPTPVHGWNIFAARNGERFVSTDSNMGGHCHRTSTTRTVPDNRHTRYGRCDHRHCCCRVPVGHGLYGIPSCRGRCPRYSNRWLGLRYWKEWSRTDKKVSAPPTTGGLTSRGGLYCPVRPAPSNGRGKSALANRRRRQHLLSPAQPGCRNQGERPGLEPVRLRVRFLQSRRHADMLMFL